MRHSLSRIGGEDEFDNLAIEEWEERARRLTIPRTRITVVVMRVTRSIRPAKRRKLSSPAKDLRKVDSECSPKLGVGRPRRLIPPELDTSLDIHRGHNKV